MPRRDTALRQSFLLRSEGLARRVAGGAGYQFLGIALRTLLTLGSTAILARLLTPADFGYVAMATVVTEFAALLGAFGFSNVLIQRRRVDRLQFDTLFWAMLAIEAVLAAGVFALSFLAGWLFDDANVGPLLRLMSLSFLIGGLSAVPGVVLVRLMRFGAVFWINMGTNAVRSAVAVLCALAGLGMWSLVVGSLVGSAVGVVMHFAAVPYRPRARFSWPVIARSWRTSTGYFGNTAVYYVNMNLDLMLIGRHLGAASLGYYQNARSLTDEIRGRIAMPIQQVLFPAFASLQDDRPRFQQLVMRAGRLLVAVVVPIGFGVSANARELVLVLYGPQWEPMVPVMAMFGLSAALRASAAIASSLFNANDRVGLAFRYNVWSTVLLIGAVLLAMPYGIEAVAAAVALVSLYALVVFRAALRLIGLGVRDLARLLVAPVLASLVMWLATLGLRVLDAGRAPALLLLVHVLAGAAVYLVVLFAVAPAYRRELRALPSLFLKRN
jgi:PST family polysaccharide transporter